MVNLLQVISISRGCAKPSGEDLDTCVTSLDKLSTQIYDERTGTLLGINTSLEDSILDELKESPKLYKTKLGVFLRATRKQKLRFVCDNLPIFADEDNDIDDFFHVDELLLERKELGNLLIGKRMYSNEPIKCKGKTIRIRRLDQFEPRIINNSLNEGASWQDFENMLYIPLIWAQRFRIVDPYFVLNSFKSGQSSSNSEGNKSALDRLIESIIRIRKLQGTPLKELEITVHYKHDSHPKNSISFEETVSHVMNSASKFPELGDWIEKVNFRHYNHQMSITGKGKERLFIFENSSHGFCFPSTARGIEVDSNGVFFRGLDIRPPVDEEKMENWKNILKSKCKVIPIV